MKCILWIIHLVCRLKETRRVTKAAVQELLEETPENTTFLY
jgi:hypothetical protein